MKILVYNKNNFDVNLVTKYTIIIVTNVDLQVFKRYVKKKKIKLYKVYVIKNFIQGYEELFAYYLKHNIYKKHSFTASLKIILDWEIFIELYNTRQYHEASRVLNKLDNVTIFFNTSSLKNNLLKFINKVKIPYFEKGIFIQDTAHLNTINDNWINKEFSYFSFINTVTFNDPKWNDFTIHIQNLINSLSPFGITDELSKKLFSLSIYYYKMAYHHLKNKNYVTSYTLLHRSLDTFYQYKCRANGSSLRLATNGKLEYSSYVGMVTLINSEKYITGFTTNTAFIDTFNKRRNKLFLTHGPYFITKNEVLSKFKEVRNHIYTIDGSLWYNTFKTIIFKHKINPLDLFLYEPSFNTYLNDATDQFKKFTETPV